MISTAHPILFGW